MSWYPSFLAAVLLIFLLSTKRDRAAAGIVLVASVISYPEILFVSWFVNANYQPQEQWMTRMMSAAAFELVTIMALWHWARGRTGYIQMVCLSVAGLAHILSWAGYLIGTHLLYWKHSTVILVVALVQIAGFHDTLIKGALRLRGYVNTLRSFRGRSLRPSGLHAQLLRNPRLPPAS